MNDRSILVQEKLIAGIVWVGMLLALAITSLQALATIARSGMGQLVLAFVQNRDALTSSGLDIFAYVALALILVAIVILIFAWLRFANLTNEVIIAISAPRDDTEPVFSSFLDLSDVAETTEEGQENVYEAKGSMFGDMIRLLAFVWAVLLVISPIISIGQ